MIFILTSKVSMLQWLQNDNSMSEAAKLVQRDPLFKIVHVLRWKRNGTTKVRPEGIKDRIYDYKI